MVAQYAKPPVEPFQFARNGKYPDALFQSELADAANRCALYRLKQIGHFARYTQSIPGTYGDTERVAMRFRWVSSPYASKIIFKAWMAQAPTESTSSRPRARLRIANDGGTTQADGEIAFGAAPSSATTPDKLSQAWTFLLNTAATDFWTPTANTEYQATFSEFDNARIIACVAYESALNVDPPFAENYAATTPILDVDRQELITGARQMWKTQAAPLFHWSTDQATRSRSSSTPVNAIDNSSGSVATNTVGYTLDLRNRARTSAGTVPVKFWAYGSSAGSGGTVTLRDSGGTAVLTISGITTAGWYSTTGTLPATLAKYDLWYAGDGTNAFTFQYASLLQYATGS